MTTSRVSVLAFFGAVAILAMLQSAATAQLFGNQNIGTSPGAQGRSPFGTGAPGARGAVPSLGPATGPAAGPAAGAQTGAAGPGMLDGNERFVRGNRSRQDFVGTGRNDLTGFVGAGQAIGIGRVPAATDSFRLEATSAARINKPLPKQPAQGMYYPRLVLDLETKNPDLNSRTTAIAASSEIQRRAKNVGGENVQVLVAGETAILQGSVDSIRAAELVVNILSFEPGIDRVDNQLTVR
jgi:hypothetical protein